jgi:TolA-binding protein
MRLLIFVLAFALAGPVLAQESAEEQLAAASALFDAKKYPQAAQRLEQFLTDFPRHDKAAAAALAQGRCYTELKQFEKAVPAYEKAAASKDPAIRSSAQLGLGEAAIQTSQWEKALGALDEVSRSTLKPEQAPIIWYWKGEASFELKRYPQAEEAYLKVAQEFGRSELAGSAWYGAGLAALQQKKPDVARRYLQTVVDRFPKSEDRVQAQLLLAQIDLESKKYKEARAGFEAVLRDPAAGGKESKIGTEASEGLVQVLLELEDFAAASGQLEGLLARLPAADPQRPRAQLTLGTCRFRQKQYEASLTAYREAARSSDAAVAVEAQYWAGNALLALNRHAEAAAQFSQLVEGHPNSEFAPRAQLRLGDAHVAAKKVEAAIKAYQEVSEKYPNAAQAAEARKSLAQLTDSVVDVAQLEALLKNAAPADRARGKVRLGRLYLEAKKYDQAESTLSDVLKDPEARDLPGEAGYLLGLALDAQQKAAPAASAFSEAVAKEPRAAWAADAQSRLAWLYLDLKKPAEAERAALAAIALKPMDAILHQARLALVQSSLVQEKWETALSEARGLLDANPTPETTAMLLFTTAWINEKLQKPAVALPLWERIVAQHRASEYAAEAYVRIGDARFKAEKFAEARVQYETALREFARSPLAREARFKLGTTLFRLEKAVEAASEWDQVAKAAPADDWTPEALYWAGVALDKANKKTEAIQRLEKLANDFPKHMRTPNAKIRLAALKAVAG